MKNLALIISLCFVLVVSGQNQKSNWAFGLSTSISTFMLNGYHSNYNPYFNAYGKVPYELAGFETVDNFYLVYPSGSRSFSVAISVNYKITNRFSLGVEMANYWQIAPDIINDGYIEDGLVYTYNYGTANAFSYSINPKFRLNKRAAKSAFIAKLIVGSTYFNAKNGYYLRSEKTGNGIFKGTAEEYFKRNDWAFTWGAGLEYRYDINTHWGIVASGQLTTFNWKPEMTERYSYKINGEELVQTLSIREQQILFSDSFQDDPSNLNSAQILPAENYRYFVPQFSVGMVYNL